MTRRCGSASGQAKRTGWHPPAHPGGGHHPPGGGQRRRWRGRALRHPYLLPNAVMAELGAGRSHASGPAAAVARIRADPGGRGRARYRPDRRRRARSSPAQRPAIQNGNFLWIADARARFVRISHAAWRPFQLAIRVPVPPGSVLGEQGTHTGCACVSGFLSRAQTCALSCAELAGAGSVPTQK